MGATIMLFGAGHLGGPILDRLAALETVGRIMVVARDRARLEARCNLARLTAAAAGPSAVVEPCVADLARTEEVAAVLRRAQPDVVVNAASRQTWWLPDLFPPAVRAALRQARYGVWLPLHLAPALDLARALELAGFGGIVLNAAYPDVVNVVWGRVATPPLAGLGNVEELVAKVRVGVSANLQVHPDELDIRLVAHHALQRFAFAGTPPADDLPPFWLGVSRGAENVGERGRAREELLRPYPLPGGPAWGSFSAAAAVSFIGALLARSDSDRHAPGPHGLPGGYPVTVGDGRLAVRDVTGLARDAAISINERSHRFDGIETIGDDGTVAFGETAAAAIRAVLGYQCAALAPADATRGADELAARFGELAARHGVELDAMRR
jgi:hypothetical protein